MNNLLEISSDRIKCIEVNVDESFDLFAFMKSKKNDERNTDINGL